MTFVTLFVGLQTHAELALTNSKKYENFDQPTKERTDFIFSENDRVNARLKTSPSRKAFESYLLKLLNVETEPNAVYFTTTDDEIKLVDHGFAKPQEVVLVKGEVKEVLLSTDQYKKNNTVRFRSLKLNPTENRLLVTLSFDDSDDEGALVVIDLATKKLITPEPIRFHANSDYVFWRDDDHILFQDLLADYTDIVRELKFVNTADGSAPGTEISVYGEDLEFNTLDEFGLLIDGKNESTFISPYQTSDVLFTAPENLEYIGVKNKNFYLTRTYLNDQGADALDLYTIKAGQLTLLKTFQGVISSTWLLKNAFGYVTQVGPTRTLNLYNFNTDQTTQLTLPEYAGLGGISDYQNAGQYRLRFYSDLVKGKVRIWNGQNQSVVFDEAFKAEMLETPDLSLDVTYKNIQSFDGTQIPVRIVSKKGASLQNAPVYMEVYGGFGSEGYMFPIPNPLNLQFIKRGGVFVGPGLRGGGELGEKWHLAAKQKNKAKTFEDLAAVAKSFIDSGQTTPDKIIITGASNGGLTVAATGLLYPQYFGLVIPVSGVLDLLDKEKLDARFDGWAKEYGNANKPEDAQYLAQLSPLELVSRAENGPKFLLINGRKDTRVNPAHSIKMAKAAADLRAAGHAVDFEMISLNNVGHHPYTTDGDFIGVRAKLIKWSLIYDFLGIGF